MVGKKHRYRAITNTFVLCYTDSSWLYLSSPAPRLYLLTLKCFRLRFRESVILGVTCMCRFIWESYPRDRTLLCEVCRLLTRPFVSVSACGQTKILWCIKKHGDIISQLQMMSWRKVLASFVCVSLVLCPQCTKVCWFEPDLL